VPASPEARLAVPNDSGVVDAIEADVVEEQPTAPAPPPAPAAPPPAWPPVPAAAGEPAESGDAAAPPVPEELAAALDITSEIPRVRPDRESEEAGWNVGTGASRPVAGQGTPGQGTPVVPAPYSSPLPQQPAEERLVAPQPARVKAYADETMELPIFRELESAWFRARPPGSEETLTQPGQPPTPPPPAAPPGPPLPAVPPPLVPQAAAPPPVVPAGVSANGGPQQGWGSLADEGWTAASQAADPQVDGTTSAGLPRRVPMAQLVPGGVERETANANRRSPEQVRGLLSAYHRGVQRGRTRTGDDAKTPESTTTGNPPQGGKEQEA
jgi:hypothetical protein